MPKSEFVYVTYIKTTPDKNPSPFIEAVSMGWPRTLSNLKTFLETGETVLEGTR
jgi:hypothetical protein